MSDQDRELSDLRGEVEGYRRALAALGYNEDETDLTPQEFLLDQGSQFHVADMALQASRKLLSGTCHDSTELLAAAEAYQAALNRLDGVLRLVPPATIVPENPRRPHAVQSAGYWFNGARALQLEGGKMAEALNAMENAYNHVEGALVVERQETARLTECNAAANRALVEAVRARTTSEHLYDTMAAWLEKFFGYLPECCTCNTNSQRRRDHHVGCRYVIMVNHALRDCGPYDAGLKRFVEEKSI